MGSPPAQVLTLIPGGEHHRILVCIEFSVQTQLTIHECICHKDCKCCFLFFFLGENYNLMLMKCYEGKVSVCSRWWSPKPSKWRYFMLVAAQDGRVRRQNQTVSMNTSASRSRHCIHTRPSSPNNLLRASKWCSSVMFLIHSTLNNSWPNEKTRTLFPSYLQESLLFHINTFYFTAIVELAPNYFTLDLTVCDRRRHHIFVHWLKSFYNSHCKRLKNIWKYNTVALRSLFFFFF